MTSGNRLRMNNEMQMTADHLKRVNEEIRRVNEEIRRVNEESRKTNDEIRKTNDEARKVAVAAKTDGRSLAHERSLVSSSCHRTGFRRLLGRNSASRQV